MEWNTQGFSSNHTDQDKDESSQPVLHDLRYAPLQLARMHVN